MSASPNEPGDQEHLVEALSPFRAAFARAREEGVAVVEPQRAPLGNTAPPPGIAVARFEVRIEKRRGKRDASRWTALGNDGWELVTVVGKRAFFRRRRSDFAR